MIKFTAQALAHLTFIVAFGLPIFLTIPGYFWAGVFSISVPFGLIYWIRNEMGKDKNKERE